VWSLAELGDFADAVSTATESLEIAEAAQHAYTLAHAHLGLGGVLIRQGRFEEAIPVLERGLAASARAPMLYPPLAADLGVALAHAGRLDEGLAMVSEGVARARAIGRIGRLALHVTHLGAVSLLAGRPGPALELAREALDLAVTRKEQGNQVYALWLLGTIAAQTGEDGGVPSLEPLHRALTLADELGMRSMRARCLLALGRAGVAIGAPGARAHLSEARALLRDMGMTYWISGAEEAGAALDGSRAAHRSRTIARVAPDAPGLDQE
jgi:tetratricopeptide (TPR) repeat protein